MTYETPEGVSYFVGLDFNHNPLCESVPGGRRGILKRVGVKMGNRIRQQYLSCVWYITALYSSQILEPEIVFPIKPGCALSKFHSSSLA